MSRMSNKMMVAAAMNRRRMEGRRVPMYTDTNGNNRRLNPSYEMQDYYPNDTDDMRYYNGSQYPTEMRQQRDRSKYMTDDTRRQMYYEDDRRMRDNAPMIGFDREYERGMDRNRMSKSYNSYDGDIYAKGSIMMSPNHNGDEMNKPVDEMTAMKWVKAMQPEDGSDGMHWKFEQTEQVRKQTCPECKPYDFFVAMNMMRADYIQVAKKLGVDSVDFFANMAKAFLCDKDAGENKLRKYMTIIPK